MQAVADWILINWVEITAAVLGFWSIYLQIKRKPLYWPVSIVMVLIYVYVFFQAKFYADMSFQFYYLVVSIYGWYFWLVKRIPVTNEEKSDITRLKRKGIIISIAASLGFFVILAIILKNFTDSNVPYGDAFTTALSFVATWLLARKILENWLFWIVVDLVSTILYFYKELYPTAILFTFLTILAVVGFYKWKKDVK